ncbi:pseudouridine synthase [Acidovorax lacteus]
MNQDTPGARANPDKLEEAASVKPTRTPRRRSEVSSGVLGQGSAEAVEVQAMPAEKKAARRRTAVPKAALAPEVSAASGVEAPREEAAGPLNTADPAPAAPERAPRSDGAGQRPGKPGRVPAEVGASPEGYRFEDVVSGRFDNEDPDAESVPSKRVLQPQVETPKLHKVLAQAGLGSRLEMEQLILEGRISVNNEPAHIGQRIQYGDQIKVNGKPIRYRIDPPPARVLAYHKPVGEVVTHDDPQNRPTVFRKLPKLAHGKWQSVGRLDLNTEGLLLFTSSGELANKLMHPRFGLEREYAVRVLGALSNEEKQRLLEGVRLDDGMAAFGSIEEGGGEGSNCWYRVTISEGRNREVRRMFESVGHAVSRLIRIRYGAMLLPRGLRRGAWIELDDVDIRRLMQAAGVMPGKPEGSRQGGGPAAEGRRAGSGRSQRDGRPSGSRGGRDGSKAAGKGGGGRGASSQPDPMKTSVGYIGHDSLARQRQDRRQAQKRNGRRGPGR